MSSIPAYLVDKFKNLHCNTSDNFIGVLVKMDDTDSCLFSSEHFGAPKYAAST